MSKSWDDLVTRVALLEARLEAVHTEYRSSYDDPARRRDEEIERRIDRIGKRTVSIPLNLYSTLSGTDGPWTITNHVDDRIFDESAATLTENNHVTGTIVNALANLGIFTT